MLDKNSTELVCPKADGTTLSINLSAILQTEQRLEEVACLTMQKAPELLTAYNRAWIKLHETVVTLTNEKNKLKQKQNTRKSIILLDEAPKILKEKGIETSKDVRDAIINSDAEYLDISDKLNYITSVIEYLKGKAQAFENAYTSVKRIMREDGEALRFSKPDTSGGIPENAQVGKAGYGKPRY